MTAHRIPRPAGVLPGSPPHHSRTAGRLRIFTAPVEIRNSASPGSPTWNTTSPRRKRRIRVPFATRSRAGASRPAKNGIAVGKQTPPGRTSRCHGSGRPVRPDLQLRDRPASTPQPATTAAAAAADTSAARSRKPSAVTGSSLRSVRLLPERGGFAGSADRQRRVRRLLQQWHRAPAIPGRRPVPGRDPGNRRRRLRFSSCSAYRPWSSRRREASSPLYAASRMSACANRQRLPSAGRMSALTTSSLSTPGSSGRSRSPATMSVRKRIPITDADLRAPRASASASIRAEDGPQRDRQDVARTLDEREPAVADRQRAVLEERANRLGHEQRVAAGPLVDGTGVVRVERGTRHLVASCPDSASRRPPSRMRRTDRRRPRRAGRAGRMAARITSGTRAARSTRTSTSALPDGSIQWRSSMTTTRGPDVSRIRST